MKWLMGLLGLSVVWGLGCGEDGNPPVVVELPGGATMEFVRIEPGTFKIGSPLTEPGRDEDEGPKHEVTISRGFYLGKTEITQAQWEAVMGTRPWAGQDYVQEKPNYPAVYISWNGVQDFIHRLNTSAGSQVYRLPTEAEWEYACRAGTTTRWSFGDDESQLGNYAWHTGNSWDQEEQYGHAVATKRPNPWGLCDMHGNVNEWVQDWYDQDYYARSVRVDPPGPVSGSQRVFRGGYFHNNGSRRLRSANRFYYMPEARAVSLGARLLKQRL